MPGPTWGAQGFYDVKLTWRDDEGKSVTTTTHVSADVTVVTLNDAQSFAQLLAAAFQATSNCLVYSASVEYRAFANLVLPSQVKFGSAEDKGFAIWEAQQGSQYRTMIPAPSDGIFLTSDDETINPAAVNFAALTAFLTTPQLVNTHNHTVVTRDVHQLAAYIQGYRERKKAKRRLRPGIATEVGGD